MSQGTTQAKTPEQASDATAQALVYGDVKTIKLEDHQGKCFVYQVVPQGTAKPQELQQASDATAQALVYGDVKTIKLEDRQGKCLAYQVMSKGTTQAKILRKAPNFTAQALDKGQEKTIKLDDYKGKYLILVFYPGDFTYICPTEVVEFDKYLKQFQECGAEIIVCSNDSIKEHERWVKAPREERGLGLEKGTQIPLISDEDRSILNAYNVDLEDKECAARGLFIIDPQGTVRQITINEPGVGRNVEEVLRLLKASQKHAETSRGCPVNWTSTNDTTIQLDEEGSKEYFKQFGGGKEE